MNDKNVMVMCVRDFVDFPYYNPHKYSPLGGLLIQFLEDLESKITTKRDLLSLSSYHDFRFSFDAFSTLYSHWLFH